MMKGQLACLAVLLTVMCFADASSRRIPRKLTKHASWMDTSIPLPHSVHNLQHVPLPGRRKLMQSNPELTPLFPGYGTHFAYVYVGSPPQRQSVIIDTGSHYTAFPCTGCSQCGQHTDAYWNLKNSSTAVIPNCGASKQPCQISQSYTEGSSWHAFKVVDKLWVGSTGMDLIPGADNYAVNFTFGCQTTETGLFRTQLADGIMGMSISDDTLPNQLVKQGVVDNKIFSLCFRVGGGIMTLGGVDQRIHTKKAVNYVKLDSKSNGWFGVVIKNIVLESPEDKANPKAALTRVPVVVDAAKYSTGKGAIVDSGTTDTYLPTEIASQFMEAFKKISGTAFTTGNIKLTADQLNKLPTIVYMLEGLDGKNVEVSMPWTSYVDSVGDGKYSFRVYLSEKSGTVLGANFMNGYNIIFDAAGSRIGFAKSLCNYEEYAPVVTKAPTAPPTTYPGQVVTKEPCKSDEMVAYTECTARCDKNDDHYIATGQQDFVSKCNPNSGDMVTKDCTERCNKGKVVRAEFIECPDQPWTECEHSCVKSRKTVSESPAHTGGRCSYRSQTATCYTGSCPIDDGDYLIYIDMRVRMEPYRWSYVHTEAFYQAMKALFKIKTESVELMNDAGNEFSSATKLHFQIRLRARDYKGVRVLHDAAEKIAESVQAPEFASRLIAQLDAASAPYDKSNINRFGWLFDEDIEVLNAVAMPMGMDRNPEGPHVDYDPLSLQTRANLTLVGIALAALLVLVIVCYLHFKLRQQYALFEKDKGDLSQGGQALHRMWNRFAHIASKRGELKPGSSLSSMSQTKRQMEMEMSNRGLLREVDEEEEEFFGDTA